MSEDAKRNALDMQMAFMGNGEHGHKTLVMVLKECKVFQLTLKPEEVEARNAGMRILFDMLQGDQTKLIGALIKGLGGTYEEFKNEIRMDSKTKGNKGD